MAISSVASYKSAEEFETAFIAAPTTITPRPTREYTCRVTRVEFDNLWLCYAEDSGARIKHTIQPSTRGYIRFPTEPLSHFANSGELVGYGQIIYHSRAEEYFERSWGPLSWGAISLPSEKMSAYSVALTGIDLTASHDPLIVTPSPSALTELLEATNRAVLLAQASSDSLQAEPAHALEQALIGAVFTGLDGFGKTESRWSQQTHRLVMRRFARLLRNEPDRAFYVPEICALIGVPERTLRLCCQEHLGMGPKQFLLTRRMHLVHRALSSVGLESTSVSAVASRYGFWHFGRFSAQYRSMFGESPSATLRRCGA